MEKESCLSWGKWRNGERKVRHSWEETSVRGGERERDEENKGRNEGGNQLWS